MIGSTKPAAALFDLSAFRAGAAGQDAKPERKQSQIWLNVGVEVPAIGEDGQPTTKFISLPVGIPLDGMEEMTAKGSSVEWHQMVEAKNTLLKLVKDASAGLEPGKSVSLTGLTVQAYRRTEEGIPQIKDNPLVAALLGAAAKPQS